MSSFTGVGALARFALRRDRVRLVIWIVAMTVIAWVTVASIEDLYPDGRGLAEYEAIVEANQTVVAMSGPSNGVGTVGGRSVFELWPITPAVALLAVLEVVRHTRADEEAGRAELIRSTVVGRHAHSAAAVIVAVSASIGVGAGIAGGFVASGLDATGSVVLGAAVAGLGIAFAGVGLVAAQIPAHARTARGIAVAAIGGAFVLRGIGDVGDGTLSWLSPFGWMQATRPLAGDRWWPLLLLVGFGAATTGVALAIEARRDVGAGVVHTRPGPATGAPSLARPLGLAWRLQRGSVAAWVAGAFVAGLAMGSVVHSADDFVGDNEGIRDYLASIGGASLTDIFLVTLLTYMALAAAGFALSSVQRPRSEEVAHRAEWVLATPLSRAAWVSGHLATTLVGAFAVLVAGGAGLGIAHGLQVSDLGQVPAIVGAALVWAPAVLVLAAMGVAVYGLLPRALLVVWVAYAFVLVVAVFGEVFGLPGWVMDLSPLSHVPQVPASDLEVLPLALLTVIAAVLGSLGLVGLRRRDIA